MILLKELREGEDELEHEEGDHRERNQGVKQHQPQSRRATVESHLDEESRSIE